MDENNFSGPVHEDSNLLDSPDFWVYEADSIIDQLRLELQIIKNENQTLKDKIASYESKFVALSLEIGKI